MPKKARELHISIHLEPLAAAAVSPAILSIGAVAFNPDLVQTPQAISGNPSLRLKLSCRPVLQTHRHGGAVAADTLARRDSQGAKAMPDECLDGALDQREAVLQLHEWLKALLAREGEAAVHAWSSSAREGLTWWARACADAGVPYPVQEHNEHCLHTLAAELRSVRRPRYGERHDALDSAISQAAWVQRLRGVVRRMRKN